METFPEDNMAIQKGIPDVTKDQFHRATTVPNPQRKTKENAAQNHICVHGKWVSKNICKCDPGYVTEMNGFESGSEFILCGSPEVPQQAVSSPYYKSKLFVISAVVAGGILLVMLFSVVCKRFRRRRYRGEQKFYRDPATEFISLPTRTLPPAPVLSSDYLSQFYPDFCNTAMATNYCLPVPMQLQDRLPQSAHYRTAPFPELAWQPSGGGMKNNRYAYKNTALVRNPSTRADSAAYYRADDVMPINNGN